MEGLLAQAVRAAEARKEAATGADSGVVGAERDQVLLSYIGFGIDPDELNEISGNAGAMWFGIIMQGLWNPPSLALQSCWLDGLLVGCMLGQMAEQAAHSGA